MADDTDLMPFGPSGLALIPPVYAHSAPPPEGFKAACVHAQELENSTLGEVGAGQSPCDRAPLLDDLDAQGSEALNQRRAGRRWAGAPFGVDPIERLPPKPPTSPPLHQRQHHQRPD